MATESLQKYPEQVQDGHRVTISPQQFQAVIFDMDGVVTQTASVHAAAWKTLFDGFLQNYAETHHQPFVPFDIEHDYLEYVDGKKREDGLTSFLESRHIQIPMGSPDDSPKKDTVYGLAKRKDSLFLEHLHRDGVKVYDSTIALIKTLRKNHVKTAIISASRNCQEVLQTAKVQDLFDARVDGVVAAQLHLPGKPKPDVFLEAAKRLGVTVDKAVVFEDAVAGVQAGHAGHFALVIGVNRAHHAEELKAQGADLVVDDLAQVQVSNPQESSVHHSNLQDEESEIDEWVLTYDSYEPAEEGRRETLCALGNGYYVTRAAAIETHDDGVHYPGMYLAGGYNRLISHIVGAEVEKDVENEALVNFPNWLVLKFKINQGAWFHIDEVEILSFQQQLNLEEGIFSRTVRFRDKLGQETEVFERRLVHMKDQYYSALELIVTPLNWSGSVTLHSALDGTVINNNVKRFSSFDKKHLELLKANVLNHETIFLKVQTNQSHIKLAQAARTRVFIEDKAVQSARQSVEEDAYIAQEIHLDVQNQEKIRVEKVVTIFTSKDNAISECGFEAKKWSALAPDFNALYQSHRSTWKHLWHRFDIDMHMSREGLKKRAALVLRLHVFHLLQSMSYNSMGLDIGVPARGWHGEAYQGHIFWDNVLVYRYLNLRLPDLTASLLKYRYRRLDSARQLARQAGFKGAMFPWQSGSNGEEETPLYYVNPLSGKWERDYTHLQRHVNSAIVYNVWQYYQVSGDIDFMFSYGAEIILEVARFWASIATYNSELDRYEIAGIVGPDEYHDRFPADSDQPGVKNNAYTNVMAAWVLWRALDVLELMPVDYRESLMDKLALTNEELKHWDELSRKFRVIFQEDGIISQFEGYETLAELDWDQFRVAHQDVQHVDDILRARGDSPNNYKVSKQADLLMLFYLFDRDELQCVFDRLGYEFKPEMIRKNIDYYQQRTTHGSTLSRVVYSWVVSRSDRARSLNLFVEAFESDLNDIQGGTTPEGIHLGAMAGTLDIVQRCYTGLIMKEDTLRFNPRLPDKIECIEFIMHYRFHCIKVCLTQEKLVVEALPSVAQKIKIGFNGGTKYLEAGQKLEFDLADQKEKSKV